MKKFFISTETDKIYFQNENINSVFHMYNEDYVTICDAVYNDKTPYDLSIPVQNKTQLRLDTHEYGDIILNNDEEEIPYDVAES